MMTRSQIRHDATLMSCILSSYPLSLQYRGRLEADVTPSFYFSISELRQLGAWKALRKLFALRVDHLYIALEDEGSRAVLPVLQVMAGFTLARSIRVITPELERSPVSRRQIAQAFLEFIWTS